MSNVQATITSQCISLVVDGQSFCILRSAPNAPAILAELRNGGNAQRLLDLASVRKALHSYSGGTVVFDGSGGAVLNGWSLPSILAQRVYQCFKDQVPFEHLLKFFTNLRNNPSTGACEQLYTFLEHCGMPITPSGTFLAYKGVQEDFYSVQSNPSTHVIEGIVRNGHIYNAPGQRIRVRRSDVCADIHQGCGPGLHAGSESYALGWGSRRVIVEINPADVVSVPSDCSFQKLRCCAYNVVAEYAGRMGDSAVKSTSDIYGATFVDPVDPCPETLVGVFGTGVPPKQAERVMAAAADAAVVEAKKINAAKPTWAQLDRAAKYGATKGRRAAADGLARKPTCDDCGVAAIDNAYDEAFYAAYDAEVKRLADKAAAESLRTQIDTATANGTKYGKSDAVNGIAPNAYKHFVRSNVRQIDKAYEHAYARAYAAAL